MVDVLSRLYYDETYLKNCGETRLIINALNYSRTPEILETLQEMLILQEKDKEIQELKNSH